jgi:hypothetical protein
MFGGGVSGSVCYPVSAAEVGAIVHISAAHGRAVFRLETPLLRPSAATAASRVQAEHRTFRGALPQDPERWSGLATHTFSKGTPAVR